MPICTCTISKSALATDTKTAPAREMASIHSSVNHVPSTYLNVVFTSYRQGSVYTDNCGYHVIPTA